MAKLRLFEPGFRLLDTAGLLMTTGATITAYLTATTTPADTFTDAAGGTPNANPYTVPATGIPNMWLTDGTVYRIIVKNPAGSTLHDIADIVGIPASGTTGAFTLDNSTNTGVSLPVTITHTTTGTPGAGIGTGIAFKSESADESPSDIGQIEFAFGDVGAGTEDSYFTIWTRTAGAALKKAYRFLITGVGDYVFTGAPTATRTITLPDANLNFATVTSTQDFTPVYFRATMQATQSISNATFTVVNLTVVTDNQSYWDATNKRFKPLIAGVYQISGCTYIPIADGVLVATSIFKNGGAHIASQILSGGASNVGPAVSGIVTLNGSTDYISLMSYHVNGGAVTMPATVQEANFLTAVRICGL